jgi:galactose mutarotase-like enzyme
MSEGETAMAAGAKDMITIAAGDVRARIARRGAELVSWQVGGRELLWQGDPASWHEQSPILFPVVGWTRNAESRVAGKTYPLALHGFARFRDFAVTGSGPEHVTLALADDAETRALYPFGFALEIHYSVGAAGLRAEAVVRNTGDETMPYSLGLHPGFRWPIAGRGLDGAGGEGDAQATAMRLAAAQASHAVTFAQEERPDVPVTTTGGLISSRRRQVPLEGCVLPLDPALFSADALIFENARSRSVRFSNGRDALDLSFENFPTLVLWMRPGAAFLCIEGWCGSGDPEDFTGNLDEKPGIVLLPPGGEARHAMGFAATLA